VIILLLVFIKMTKHGFNTWRLHLQPINLHPGRLMAKWLCLSTCILFPQMGENFCCGLLAH